MTSRHSAKRSISTPSGVIGVPTSTVRAASRMSRAGQFGHRVVVAVGGVGLELAELRRVGGVDALVAEHLAELVHPVDPADDRLLQVQLGRDAQAHVEVEGVELGVEGTGRRPAVHDLQHRGLDLEEPVVVQGLAQRAGDRGALFDHPPRVRAHDQVDVALPDPVLLGERLVGHRERPQRLGGHPPTARQHGQLTAARGDDLGRSRTPGRRDRRRPSSRQAPARRPRRARASPAVRRHPRAASQSRACRCCGRRSPAR